MISEQGSNAKIEIDGGVGLDNAQDLLATGADVLVAGSAIFGTDDPVQTTREMKAVSFVEA